LDDIDNVGDIANDDFDVADADKFSERENDDDENDSDDNRRAVAVETTAENDEDDEVVATAVADDDGFDVRIGRGDEGALRIDWGCCIEDVAEDVVDDLDDD